MEERRAIADTLIDTVARAEGWALLAIVLVLVFAESAVLLDFIAPGEVGLTAPRPARRLDAPTVATGPANEGAVRAPRHRPHL